MKYFLNMLYIYEKGTPNVKINMIRYITTRYRLTQISAYRHWSCEFESWSWRSVLDTTLWDKVCKWLATVWWFSLGTPFSSTI